MASTATRVSRSSLGRSSSVATETLSKYSRRVTDSIVKPFAVADEAVRSGDIYPPVKFESNIEMFIMTFRYIGEVAVVTVAASLVTVLLLLANSLINWTDATQPLGEMRYMTGPWREYASLVTFTTFCWPPFILYYMYGWQDEYREATKKTLLRVCPPFFLVACTFRQWPIFLARKPI